MTLEATDLPPAGDYEKIIEFAQKFHGYAVYGSFRACADAARASRRQTLKELQTELFMAYRAGNHLGEGSVVVNKYGELLPHFQRILQEE